jgi:hypothetical protein
MFEKMNPVAGRWRRRASAILFGSQTQIAWGDSQAALRLRNEPAFAQPRSEWIDRDRREDVMLGAAEVTLDNKPITHQPDIRRARDLPGRLRI